MKILVARSCLRHSESGLEEPEISDAFGATVPCYLVLVNLQDLFEVEEERCQRVNLRGASVRDGAVCSPPPALCETTLVALRRELVQPPGTCHPIGLPAPRFLWLASHRYCCFGGLRARECFRKNSVMPLFCRVPSATARTVSTRASLVARNSTPFSSRNTSAAAIPVRLLPSRNGWFFTMWKR